MAGVGWKVRERVRRGCAARLRRVRGVRGGARGAHHPCCGRGAERGCARRQDTFYLDLGMHQTPHWLSAEMAEQLRSSVEARLTLDAEYAQARPAAALPYARGGA